MKKRKKAHYLLWTGGTAIALGMGLAIMLFLAPNFNVKEGDETFLFIREQTTLEQVFEQLNEKVHVRNIPALKTTARIMRYNKIRPGRYRVADGMNNLTLIRHLRSGHQTPVKLKINNIRTKEQLASLLSKQLMPDSSEVLTLLNDSAFLTRYGLNHYTSLALFLPNTYEFFWNTTAEKIFERMYREYERFWTDERRQKAAAIPLTPVEVSTLASIVDAETNHNPEKPMIAGLYINRLRKNMPLQADPTVIFAVGDFSIRRVFSTHTRVESPYNTYRNTGLPPGPIRIPTLAGLDAVLNYDRNDYIFMCAKETLNGEHNFAATWAEHKQNADRYQKALNERGIR